MSCSKLVFETSEDFLVGAVLFLFDFEEVFDVESVLVKGPRRFEHKFLHLDRWDLEVGCFQRGVHVRKLLVRVDRLESLILKRRMIM